MAEHPCTKCGTPTTNVDICDACGIKLVKEAAAKAKAEADKRKGNGQGGGQ